VLAAKEMVDKGQVREAERTLTAWLRDHPSDSTQRSFLFELLCFSGQYDRAGKHLAILSQAGPQQELGGILYFSALHAERLRHDRFRSDELGAFPPPASPAGYLNGRRFTSLADADPQIGARLEVFAAGSYLWMPFAHLASVRMEAPRRLRDLLWAPAMIQTAPDFQGTEVREVLIPVIYPFSWQASDEQLWLGRGTAWSADDRGREYPFGQKLLVMDGEEIPLLEVRSIQFDVSPELPHGLA
jgi:type VI secretion system protein ImpE